MIFRVSGIDILICMKLCVVIGLLGLGDMWFEWEFKEEE